MRSRPMQADAGRTMAARLAARSRAARRRGATTNPPVRFDTPGGQPVRRRLGHAGGRVRRAAEARHHADARCDEVGDQLEQLARYRLRPRGQPVSRLRAWLHLLLRAADARLSRLFARPRFRDQADLQAGGRGAAGEGTAQAGLHGADAGARLEHRSVSAGRAHAEADAVGAAGAGPLQPSGRHRDQVGRRAARSRHPGLDGEAQAGAGLCVGHHAGCRAGAAHGAARGDAGRGGCMRSPN